MVAEEFHLPTTIVEQIFLKAVSENKVYYASPKSNSYSFGYTDEQKKDIENISRKSGESISSIENKIDAVSKNSGVVGKQDLIDASKVFYGIEDK